MGSRDHSYECETCHEYRSGFDDLECRCDRVGLVLWADWPGTLAANLAVGGALCAVWQRAFNDGWECADFRRAVDWAPGCGRAWGGGQ